MDDGRDGAPPRVKSLGRVWMGISLRERFMKKIERVSEMVRVQTPNVCAYLLPWFIFLHRESPDRTPNSAEEGRVAA
jgi:hypothetical protein